MNCYYCGLSLSDERAEKSSWAGQGSHPHCRELQDLTLSTGNQHFESLPKTASGAAKGLIKAQIVAKLAEKAEYEQDMRKNMHSIIACGNQILSLRSQLYKMERLEKNG